MVLEGEKTRQLDGNCKYTPTKCSTNLPKVSKRKSSGSNRYYLWGLGPHRFHVSDLITTDTNDDWRKLNENENKKKGFTLIELLVCLFIIGLMMLLIIPEYCATKKDCTETIR